MTESLAIVVVTHNSAGCVGECLRSYADRSGGIEVETVVIDAASTDGTPEKVEGEFPHVRVVRAANRGYAAALNVGIRLTGAPYVLLSNPDVELLDGDMRTLVELLERRPDVGLAGIRQVDRRGALLPTIRHRPNAARALATSLGAERLPRLRLGERDLREEGYRQERSCDWLSGSFMLCRRSALEAVGGLDESYFLYWEETDLAVRLGAAGWRVVHLPQATAAHHEKDSTGSDPRFEAQAAASRRIFEKKLMGRLHGALHRAAYAIRYVLRIHRPGARRALAVTLGISPAPFGKSPGSEVRDPNSLLVGR